MPGLNPFQRFYHEELRQSEKSKWELAFLFQLRSVGVPNIDRNVNDWHPTRKWELDFVSRVHKVGLEIQGGTYGKSVECNHCGKPVTREVKGRRIPVREPLGHATGTGLKRDYEKIIAAQLLGWILLPVTGEMVDDGTALIHFLEALNQRSQALP
jgi:hypothetical protein